MFSTKIHKTNDCTSSFGIQADAETISFIDQLRTRIHEYANKLQSLTEKNRTLTQTLANARATLIAEYHLDSAGRMEELKDVLKRCLTSTQPACGPDSTTDNTRHELDPSKGNISEVSVRTLSSNVDFVKYEQSLTSSAETVSMLSLAVAKENADVKNLQIQFEDCVAKHSAFKKRCLEFEEASDKLKRAIASMRCKADFECRLHAEVMQLCRYHPQTVYEKGFYDLYMLRAIQTAREEFKNNASIALEDAERNCITETARLLEICFDDEALQDEYKMERLDVLTKIEEDIIAEYAAIHHEARVATTLDHDFLNINRKLIIIRSQRIEDESTMLWMKLIMLRQVQNVAEKITGMKREIGLLRQEL